MRLKNEVQWQKVIGRRARDGVTSIVVTSAKDRLEIDEFTLYLIQYV
jgi:hypothetical protein